MIATGLQKLDELLSGGVRGGVITDVFGANGTGKTQLILQLAASCARDGGRVLYLDTTGKFRPERIVEIQRESGAGSCLDKITVSRITNTSEQARAAEGIGGFDLVLIDSITDLFTYEYPDIESALERNALFMGHMRALSRTAVSGEIPIVATNMVRSVNDTEVESMKGAIDPFTHVKIHLARTGNKFRGRAYWALGGGDFAYGIGAAGLRDSQDI